MSDGWCVYDSWSGEFEWFQTETEALEHAEKQLSFFRDEARSDGDGEWFDDINVEVMEIKHKTRWIPDPVHHDTGDYEIKTLEKIDE